MISNIILTVFLAVYTFYILEVLISKSKRKKIIDKNKQLDVYRKISVKTIEEQKKFLSLKNEKEKFKFKNLFKLVSILHFIIMFVLFLTFRQILNLYQIPLYITIIIVIILPIFINKLLHKFNLEKSNINNIMRLK
jgi:hypothetical protein